VSYRSVFRLCLGLGLIAVPTGRLLADAPPPGITVDAASVTGQLKPLRGVNGAPDLTFLGGEVGGPGFSVGKPVDVSAGYRAAHVTLVRTHDSNGASDLDPSAGDLPPLGPGFGPPPEVAKMLDLNVLFPKVDADPALEASYNFGPTDKLIAGIKGIGAEVLFRLGRSGMTTAKPPTDLARYGEIVKHIVLHYNKGWANGFQYGIRYWEVWNEPDLGHIFWRGDAEQYYALYQAAAQAVKAADPDAQIGGPAIALVNEASPYREGFLAYVRDHKLPLDFFSWHWYSVDADDPREFAEIGKTMRGLLDRYGFTATRSFLDEWNYDFRELKTAAPDAVSSFVAAALIYMQDAPIDQTALYRADGEFDADGKPRNQLGRVLIGLGDFADTAARLAVTGGDDRGLAALAARSEDGQIVRIMVSNYQIPAARRGPRPEGDVMHEHGLFDLQLLPRRSVTYPDWHRYRLTLRGLPAGTYSLRRHHLAGGAEQIEDKAVKGGKPLDLDFAMAADMVDWFEIRRQK